jgi:uncharacterized protein (TIGR04222 family)
MMRTKKQKIRKCPSEATGMLPMELAVAGTAHLPDVPLTSDIVPCASKQTNSEMDITDPYEIAYLRGGEKEVMKLLLFDLVERGYLDIRETSNLIWTTQQLAISSRPPSLGNLSRSERQIVDWFVEPRNANEIFAMSLPQDLALACLEYHQRHQQSGWLAANSIIGSTGGQNVLVGLGIFLVWIVCTALVPAPLALLITIGAAFLLNHHLLPQRLTSVGRQGVEQLKAQVGHLMDRPKTARLGVHDPALVTLVGIFGTEILGGSVYDAFAKTVSVPDPGWEVSVDGCGSCGGCGCGCG